MGKKLTYMIKDFVFTLTDWKKEANDNPVYSEIYAKTWTECRNFVLPMNPVRRELEFAVKSILNELGINGIIKQKKRKPAVKAFIFKKEKKEIFK